MISTYDAPWISVHKEMPESDTAVLVHTPKSKSEPIQLAYHTGEQWMDILQSAASGVDIPLEDEVTHWTHFPNPPKPLGTCCECGKTLDIPETGFAQRCQPKCKE